MAKQKEEKQTSVSLHSIEELTAIYEDYLCFVRLFERALQQQTLAELAFSQMEEMYSGKIEVPWHVRSLRPEEKREFSDFLENCVYTHNRSYITLQHIKTEENSCQAPVFAVCPHTLNHINMSLPSSIERYTIVYPHGVKLKDTEFYIDGQYKAVYIGEPFKDVPLKECLSDPDMSTELSIMLNVTEVFRQNKYVLDDKFHRQSLNAYTAEKLSVGENGILELLGSFAEKLQGIYRDKYNLKDSREALKKAKEEGAIQSLENFQDYVNLRNFLRHQWDSYDRLGAFTEKQSEEDRRKRDDYVRSYLKLCDKSIIQRMKTYIEALHQMQQVIAKVCPYRMIRGISESKSKFVARVKEAYQQNPQQDIVVELNYPLVSDKYKTLHKILHKILPQVNIMDDFSRQDEITECMENYNSRSIFLQNFHSIECAVMWHCLMRGHNLTINKAWKHIGEAGIILPQEVSKWQNYVHLRKKLSHNYFDKKLRKQLSKNEDKYFQDIQGLGDRLYGICPNIVKIQKGIYEFRHNDGQIVQLDLDRHVILYDSLSSKPQVRLRGKIELDDNVKPVSQQSEKMQKEVYSNGMEFDLSGEKVVGVKLSNGVSINLNRRSIHWNDGSQWYTDAEKFNVLQINKCKLIVDKSLRVKEYLEKNHNIPFTYGDSLSVGNGHMVLLNAGGRIKTFKFKNIDGQMLQAGFRHIKDGKNLISFDDGTSIVFSGKEMTVIHADKVLSHDTRKEFAATYDTAQIPVQEIINFGNNR